MFWLVAKEMFRLKNKNRLKHHSTVFQLPVIIRLENVKCAHVPTAQLLCDAQAFVAITVARIETRKYILNELELKGVHLIQTVRLYWI